MTIHLRQEIVAGIDPGLHGALAVVQARRLQHDTMPSLLWCADLPVVEVAIGGKKRLTRRRYDVPALYALLRSLAAFEPEVVVLENATGRGNQVGGAQLSYGLGLLRMGLEAAGLRVQMVTPAIWKTESRVPKSKPAATRLARSRLEQTAGPDPFTGPRGGVMDGRAEAALLALWGLKAEIGSSKLPRDGTPS